jgi:cyclase
MTKTLLKKRLIPKLLIKHRKMGSVDRPVLVTTKAYRDVVNVGDAVSQAKIYEAQLADELLVLNIDGDRNVKNGLILGLIERLASETFMPLGVGGGVRTVEDFACLLEHGADKVCVNSAAISSPELIKEAAQRFGQQCVVVSIDFRTDAEGRARVYADGATRPTEHNVGEWAMRVAGDGAGEILLTDADRDGAGAGMNNDVIRSVADTVPVPVIASGGCGTAEHFVEGFQSGNAEAVSAGTFFCFRDQNPMQTRAHIRNAGIPIRMEL